MTGSTSPILLLFESGATAQIQATLCEAAPDLRKPVETYIVTDCGPDMQGAADRGATAAHTLLSKRGLIPAGRCTIGFDLVGLPPGRQTVGASAGLAFALATVRLLLDRDFGPVAATGEVVDSLSDGTLGPIRGIETKLDAAARELPAGSRLFYPVGNFPEVGDGQRRALAEAGHQLLAVHSVAEAIDVLTGAPMDDEPPPVPPPAPRRRWAALLIAATGCAGAGGWWALHSLEQQPHLVELLESVGLLSWRTDTDPVTLPPGKVSAGPAGGSSTARPVAAPPVATPPAATRPVAALPAVTPPVVTRPGLAAPTGPRTAVTRPAGTAPGVSRPATTQPAVKPPAAVPSASPRPRVASPPVVPPRPTQPTVATPATTPPALTPPATPPAPPTPKPPVAGTPPSGTTPPPTPPETVATKDKAPGAPSCTFAGRSRLERKIAALIQARAATSPPDARLHGAWKVQLTLLDQRPGTAGMETVVTAVLIPESGVRGTPDTIVQRVRASDMEQAAQKLAERLHRALLDQSSSPMPRPPRTRIGTLEDAGFE